MPARTSFDYAIVRVVPRVERGECINVGVILHCREQRYLAAHVAPDEDRLRAFAPWLDITAITPYLEVMPRIAAGDPTAGPIARLSVAERFHWLVAPRSTVVQVSPVHSGLCENPAAALARLVAELVLPADPAAGG